MNNLSAQVILAARDGDYEGGMQLLVIVVMVVIYAVGGLIRAKANKLKSAEEEQEQAGGKAGLKPSEAKGGVEALKERPFRQVQRPSGPAPESQARPQIQPPRRRKVARPEPAGQKLASKKADILFESLEPLKEIRLSPSMPERKPRFQELPEYTSDTIKKLGGERAGIAAETAQAEYLAEILSDYTDPDKLRRAILHYEILGRPLSLREPSGF